MTVSKSQVVVGSRVYCALHYAGSGVVYAIHGEQMPHTIQSIFGGTGVIGGNARFDIVFDNGSTSQQVPEGIVRGMQWKIFDEIASADEIAEKLAYAAITEAAKKAAQTCEDEAFAKKVVQLKSSVEYAHLQQSNGKYGNGSKLVAVNIRTELKAVFPSIRFSVRMDGYNCVNISWEDGPKKDEVEEVISKYKEGYFNSMEDIYEYDRSPWTEVFGGVKYLFTTREASPALIQRAIAVLVEEKECFFRTNEKPTVEGFKEGKYTCVAVPFDNRGLQSAIHKKMRDISCI